MGAEAGQDATCSDHSTGVQVRDPNDGAAPVREALTGLLQLPSAAGAAASDANTARPPAARDATRRNRAAKATMTTAKHADTERTFAFDTPEPT